MIYEPAEDSFLLAKAVKKYSKNKKVLDIGSGSGIQAEIALKNKAKFVVAVEIDEQSIALLKKKQINVLQSDLFEKVKDKFDLIVFNPPYLPADYREDKQSARVTTGGKKGDEIIVKFLKQSVKHLEKNGIILLLLSSLTPRERIVKLLKQLKLKYEIVEEEKLFMEKLEVWEIRVQ